MRKFKNRSEELRLYWKGWFRRKELNSGRSVRNDPFFILSSGRSGSTLLRRILTSHSQILIPPETGDAVTKATMTYIRGLGEDWRALSGRTVARFFSENGIRYWELEQGRVEEKVQSLPEEERDLFGILRSIYHEYEKKEQGEAVSIWGDKTPFLVFRMKWLQLLFPKALHILLVRDGRDVVNSMVQRRGRDLQEACHRWKMASRLILRRHGDQRFNTLLVRYEDLVGSPQWTMESIFQALGLHPPEAFSERLQGDPQERGDTILPHHQKSKHPIDPGNIGIWRKEMDQRQQERVQKELSSTLKKLGYLF
ncbi:MAG: sulfotransferase [Flavobacteriales bacterium]